VALGTVLFTDPGAPARIRDEYEGELAARGVADPDKLLGAAHALEPAGEASRPLKPAFAE
jgi:hypothetical protein